MKKIMNRISICFVLKWLSLTLRDQRMGQIIVNATTYPESRCNLFYASDADFLECLVKFARKKMDKGI